MRTTLEERQIERYRERGVERTRSGRGGTLGVNATTSRLTLGGGTG